MRTGSGSAGGTWFRSVSSGDSTSVGVQDSVSGDGPIRSDQYIVGVKDKYSGSFVRAVLR